MSSIYQIFGTDKDLEEKGFCLAYGEAEFIIARAGGANTKYQRVMERKMRPHRAAINAGTMDDEVMKKLLAEAYSEAVIFAWTGVNDKKGKSLPFNKENVVKILLDLPELFIEIVQESQRIKNYVEAAAEEDAKS